MLIGLLMLLQTSQAPPKVKPVGPAVSLAPRTIVIVRTADATVLGAIGAADANEIEVATLGVKKATSSSVKALAAMVLKDHQLSLTAGKNLANELKIERLLPNDSAMARSHLKEMADLNLLTGAAFDTMFVQVVATNHSIAMSRVTNTQMTQAVNPRVKAMVRQRLPVLTKHLTAAEKWLAVKPQEQ